MTKDKLITMFIKLLLELLSPDRVLKIINNSLNYLETLVFESKTELDDIAVLPLIKSIRGIIEKG